MDSIMKRLLYLPIILTALGAASGAAAANRPTQFWNLTKSTISEFYLAPAGTSNWGPNQCKNDKDGTVDADERLRITDVPPGTYDAKFIDVTGRSCIVRNIKVETGAIFWIEERDLKSCDHR
jgi:hypothetical protein